MLNSVWLAVRGVEILGGFSLCLQTVEFLFLRHALGENGVWAFAVQRDDLAHSSHGLRSLFAFLSREHVYALHLVLRLLAALYLIVFGASAALIMEEGLALKHGLKPRAAITHFAVSGDDPIYMLTAIIPATRRLLQRAGLKIDQIDAFEVNEAFAPVPLAWIRKSAIRMPAAIGTVSLATSCGAPGASRMPSTADSTDIAGVMMPSP